MAKVVSFGLTSALYLPADNVLESIQALGVADLEYYGDNDKEISRLSKKPSMKWVTCLTGATKPTLLERVTFTVSSSLVPVPYSAVTNDSNNIRPEEDKMVSVFNYTSDPATLGKAILQRALVALSREEAKFFLIFVLVRLPFGTIKIEMKYQKKIKKNIKNKRKTSQVASRR